ncbi:hypothetical protein RF11_07385 [Thelohanellus kitauei]|uniref:Uncharacterized protein n=1 Tax=Thelohanellus kitauei TaxID=669202 RepID=A0A0C2JUW2_THEKT|nr:hypothetical protein RF11_07385 [Thelohanellus kitauei]
MFVLTGTPALAHFIRVMIYTWNIEIVKGCLRLWEDHFNITGGGYILNIKYIMISSLGVVDGSELTEGTRLPLTEPILLNVNAECTRGLNEIIEKEEFGKYFLSDESESIDTH